MQNSRRPYVLVNVAMSLDGKIDSVARNGVTISSPADKLRLDRLRAGVDAVLVGGRTLLDEDPGLTVRDPALRQARRKRGLPENPAKVGVVSQADLKVDGDFMSSGPARRLIYTTRQTSTEQLAHLQNAGAEVMVLEGTRPGLKAVLESLHELGIQRLLVEGGGTLLAEFFRLGSVDEVSAYIAAFILGGATAPTLADGPGFEPEHAPRLVLTSVDKIDDQSGLLVHYIVEHKE
jgi:2,5-diamino-6-(ribosylamino)-4(3H)-pyrimidinone 5'-phosphate reductase